MPFVRLHSEDQMTLGSGSRTRELSTIQSGAVTTRHAEVFASCAPSIRPSRNGSSLKTCRKEPFAYGHDSRRERRSKHSVDQQWTLAEPPAGTYAVHALDETGRLLGEEITTVGSHPGERPVHGFATSFRDEDIPSILEWHRSLRSTVVQVYDWMASYTEPLGPESGWRDPSNRPVSFDALRGLARGTPPGSIAHAYVPIYAVGHGFARTHPEMLMYEDNGEPIRFMDQIVLANPGNEEWQRHFVDSYGAAAEAIGFDGFHVDTYGYPRVAFDVDGKVIDMRQAYESFLRCAWRAWPDALMSFNQVNGVPSGALLPPGPRFRYCEIWPPNDAWRHFEGLLDRSAGTRDGLARTSNDDGSRIDRLLSASVGRRRGRSR